MVPFNETGREKAVAPAAKARDTARFHAEIRQFGLRIEEMQTVRLRRQTDLIAAREDTYARLQLEVRQKQNAPDPGEPGPMRFERGLLPCQSTIRCWLAGLIEGGRLGR